MNVWAKWLLVVLSCALVAAGLAWFKFGQIRAAIAFGESFPEPTEAVELHVVSAEVWQPSTTATAELVATRSVTLSNELDGRIVAVGFAPGAEVTANQVLLRLDSAEERAALAAAKADADLARLALTRAERLISTGAGTEEARDQARARYDGAAAQVARLQAIVAKKTLRAPFAARTGLHRLEVGQYLEAGTAITRLIGLHDDIWIDFTLPQQNARIALGERITVTVPEPDGRSFFAQVIGRDAFVNESSRNVRYRAVADNASLGLYPGSLVSVTVPLGEPQNVALVPATAVRRDAFGAHVYVLEREAEGESKRERAVRRSVRLGPQQEQQIVITAGLRPGERVAANGAFKLRDGVLVDPKPPATARAERQ